MATSLEPCKTGWHARHPTHWTKGSWCSQQLPKAPEGLQPPRSACLNPLLGGLLRGLQLGILWHGRRRRLLGSSCRGPRGPKPVAHSAHEGLPTAEKCCIRCIALRPCPLRGLQSFDVSAHLLEARILRWRVVGAHVLCLLLPQLRHAPRVDLLVGGGLRLQLLGEAAQKTVNAVNVGRYCSQHLISVMLASPDLVRLHLESLDCLLPQELKLKLEGIQPLQCGALSRLQDLRRLLQGPHDALQRVLDGPRKAQQVPARLVALAHLLEPGRGLHLHVLLQTGPAL
mmetsp:Transcript_53413/g.168090  ORF Transcript_53413/g.168090 Transcript_53413/m.168090 type:complete len:285 (-) Transcript_53413:890-1744(-)